MAPVVQPRVRCTLLPVLVCAISLHLSLATGADVVAPQEVQKLGQQRLDALKQVEDDYRTMIRAGTATASILDEVARAILQAELDITDQQAKHIAAHERYLKQIQATEKDSQAFLDTGRIVAADHELLIAARLEAELGLARAKAGANPSAEDAVRVKTLMRRYRDSLAKSAEAQLGSKVTGRLPNWQAYADITGKLLQVDLDVAANPADRLAAHQAHIKAMQPLEDVMRDRFDAGRLGTGEYRRAQAVALEAQIGLLREQLAAKPEANDVKRLRELLVKRRDAYQEAVRTSKLLFEAGAMPINEIVKAARLLRDAELDLTDQAADREAIHQTYIQQAKAGERLFKSLHEEGHIRRVDYARAIAMSREAELALLREKAAAKASR